MKKFLSLILVMVLCFTLAAPGTAFAATIKITKTKLTLDVGKTSTLKITGTTKKVTWTSSSKSIATVSSKGKVTAVKEGSATITAKVSSKKYTCKVTVKPEVFDKEKALANVDGEVSDLGNGVVAIFENDYSFPVAIEVTAEFYDSNGEILGTSMEYNFYFEKGRQCAMFLAGPRDENKDSVAYSDYKVTMSVDAIVSNINSNVNDIEFNSSIDSGKVMVEVTNSGDKTCEYTTISIVYYMDEKIVGFSYDYANVQDPGIVDYPDLYLPKDENGNLIEYDDYGIFVNFSTSFTHN